LDVQFNLAYRHIVVLGELLWFEKTLRLLSVVLDVLIGSICPQLGLVEVVVYVRLPLGPWPTAIAKYATVLVGG
jgi:hypothetical protein